jgi:phosphate uptake regulator
MRMSKLYIRNLQLTGNATYTVSVPKEWVKMLGLDKGSKIYLEEMPDGSLRIYSNPTKETPTLSKEMELGKGDDVESFVRRIIAAYLAGFSIVTLKFDPELRDQAISVRRMLESSVLGFDVLRESKSEFTFYTVIDEDSMKLSDALAKLREDTHYMLEDTHSGMRNLDQNVLRGVIEQDQIVDKLYLLITKQITSMLMRPFKIKDYGLESAAEAPHIFLAARSMERISDHAVLLAKESLDMISEGREFPDWILGELRESINLFDSSTRLLFELDQWEADEVARRINEAIRSLKGRSVSDSWLQILANSIERVLGYSMNIIEAVMDISLIREAVKRSE